MAPVRGHVREMSAERQTCSVAKEIFGGLSVKMRGEVVADFLVFLGRDRFIFLGFLFRHVYSIGGDLLAGGSRLDDKSRGPALNRAKVGRLRFLRCLKGREANTVLRPKGVQLTVPPRQEDKQGKKKLDDRLFHQTVNLYKEAYTGKRLFFMWSMQTNEPSSISL